MLEQATQNALKTIQKSQNLRPTLAQKEISTLQSISSGTAFVSGLAQAQMNELLIFNKKYRGLVQTITEQGVGVVFLDNPETLKAGDSVERTHRVVDVPVSDSLLGRVIDPLGTPLDNKGPIIATHRLPIERETYPLMARAPVDTPLQTGIKAIDAFTPIGRGQRELILGDRQTGKTAIALDTIINQKNTGVICIYCSIGQQTSALARVIAELDKRGVLSNTIVVSASSDDEAGMQFIAPYAATSIGEYFMQQGKDVLIVYDDLTNHARAYREMSLLLKRPPGREAFPGDIFYIHSRLLERSTHLREQFGGGSLTALPIVATEAGNISAYIPTNIISITDGQIYLSAALRQKGIMPAIDTGRSVSRVGGDAQLPAYRALVGTLKIAYSQFEELESFAKFGTQMDERTQKQLATGRAIRQTMTQRQFEPVPAADQIAIVLATLNGLLDNMSAEENEKAQQTIRHILHAEYRSYIRLFNERKTLSDEQKQSFLEACRRALPGK